MFIIVYLLLFLVVLTAVWSLQLYRKLPYRDNKDSVNLEPWASFLTTAYGQIDLKSQTINDFVKRVQFIVIYY